MSRTVILSYAAPIPVGHEVEIVWYARSVEGFFGSSDEERPNQPWLIDKTSGVEYGAHWHLYDEGVRGDSGQIFDLPTHEPTDLNDKDRLAGKVERCRVITAFAGTMWRVQTVLTLTV